MAVLLLKKMSEIPVYGAATTQVRKSGIRE
jgi:hypothetical protein